jgi:hypothetical protein
MSHACEVKHEVSCLNMHFNNMWSITAAESCNTLSVSEWCAVSVGDWPDVSRQCGDLIFKVQSTKELWFNFQHGQEVFSFPEHPDQLWGPTSLLFNEYRGILPWVKSGLARRLTILLHLVPSQHIRTCTWSWSDKAVLLTLSNHGWIRTRCYKNKDSTFWTQSDYIALCEHNLTT